MLTHNGGTMNASLLLLGVSLLLLCGAIVWGALND